MAYMPTGRAVIDPFRVLEAAGIRSEMKVADLGVGAVGHLLFPAAQLVGPKGTVYAVDILKSVLQANQGRVKLSGADNVEFVWGDIERLNGTKLPDNSMDMALLVNILSVTKREQVLQEARRILSTGGILVVVDWKPAGTRLGPPAEKRLAKEDAIALAKQAGFVVQKEIEPGPYHYGLIFTKP